MSSLMASCSRWLLLIVFLTIGSSANALLSTPPSFPKVITDLKEAIAKGLGFQSEDFKIFGFDIRDSLVGQSVMYEFDVEIDNKVLPLKLLEDVNRWEYVDFPILRSVEEENRILNDDDKVSALVENNRMLKDEEQRVLPVLAPFQLAGPMELWIQDAKDMRLSLPHDVDAGVLKKVILADGAVVTVTGARSVTLRQPLELPLPLNRTRSGGGIASSLLTLAERLRLASRNQQGLISLRIVGPTSLTSSPSSSSSTNNRLKLKRLAPGLVELSSPSKITEAAVEEDGDTFMAPDRLWPIASVNGSNSNLRGFETLLYSVLGEKANKKGLFKLLKAEASAQTFLKMGFGLEKEIKEGDGMVNFEGFPEWKMKPESLKMHFEVLAKVDGDKVVPEKVMQVPEPVIIQDTVASNVLTSNVTCQGFLKFTFLQVPLPCKFVLL